MRELEDLESFSGSFIIIRKSPQCSPASSKDFSELRLEDILARLADGKLSLNEKILNFTNRQMLLRES